MLGNLNLNYFSSCDLGSVWNGESIRPCVKIMTLTGFQAEKFKIVKGRFVPLGCYGELQVCFCITKDVPNLNCGIISPWCHSQYSHDSRTFNEVIELPLPYCALYDYNGIFFLLTSTYTDETGVHEQLLAGANMPLYNTKKLFRQGLYEIELHPLEPHGIYRLQDIERIVKDPEFNAKPSGMDMLNRLLKVSRKHNRRELHETPFDYHARSDAERAIEEAKRDSGRLFLSVEFQFCRNQPRLTIPVIFEREEMKTSASDVRSERWNPVDEKYVKMTRSLRIADVDRKRKPNKETLLQLQAILDQPPSRFLPENESDLVWQYRFYLAEKYPDAALAKFLLAVRWEYPEQVDQAVELLHQWPAVNPEHVLELLNPHFIHPAIRRFAVARLHAARDEELLLYLYQLVQALHFENWHDIFSVPFKLMESNSASLEDSLSIKLATDSTSVQPSDKSLHSHVITRSSSVSEKHGCWKEVLNNDWKDDLATFLIHRAQSSWPVTNYLYWFLQLEAKEPKSPASGMYTHILNRLCGELFHGSDKCRQWSRELGRQNQFVNELLHLLQSISNDPGSRPKKVELLRTVLGKDEYAPLTRLEEPLALPLNPLVKICGIDASSAGLFKSTQRPAFFTFLLPDGGKYKVIFKHGDDLRRDQLVLQMIELMDVILRKENFDLRLTPYKVLVTGRNNGFVQFIESKSLQDILSQGTLLGYLQQVAPSTTDPLGIQKEVMETYIRSCAGYCVITYLLGVGDRHMENLLLTTDGRLFHIDFSFLFGNDPKPMATEVRLTRHMIEAMGGANATQFSEFWKITFTAFLVLRRHANLFLTLFSLVTNPDSHDPIRPDGNACEFLKERFCIGQSEEKAINRLASRMTESIKAIVPDIMERIHVMVQYIRQ